MSSRELYALCYGRSRYPERYVFVDGHPEREVDFGWFFFAWRDAEGWGLIDTGFDDAEAIERFGLTEHVPPARLLDRLGAREIRRVVLTHGHFDHAARAACFPRAHLLMARAELEAMRQALAGEDWNRGYRRRELEALEGLDLELLDGPVRRWGMEIEVVGGHTPGMLAVSWSPELLLAGDNAYLFANLQRPGPGPEVLSGLLARGQKLVPGHDFLLLERGSPCASGIVRLD